jgi:hypothetical protein
MREITNNPYESSAALSGSKSQPRLTLRRFSKVSALVMFLLAFQPIYQGVILANRLHWKIWPDVDISSKGCYLLFFFVSNQFAEKYAGTVGGIMLMVGVGIYVLSFLIPSHETGKPRNGDGADAAH